MPLQPWLYVPRCRAPYRTRVPCANTRPTRADSSKSTSPLLHANDTPMGQRTVLPYETRPIGVAIPHGAREDRCLPTLPRLRILPSSRVQRMLTLRYRSCMPSIGRAQVEREFVGRPHLRGHGGPVLRTPPESLPTADRLNLHPSKGGYSHPRVFPIAMGGDSVIDKHAGR